MDRNRDVVLAGETDKRTLDARCEPKATDTLVQQPARIPVFVEQRCCDEVAISMP